MSLEEHLKKRRMELEDRAIQVEQSAALQIREAYRTGYNDGYIRRQRGGKQ
jgi:hypothetical protein